MLEEKHKEIFVSYYPKYPKKNKTKKKGASTKYVLSLWSKVVRAMSNNRCALCGSTHNVQGHHIIRRGVYKCVGWFLIDNGIALCFECHLNGIHSTYFPTVQSFQEKINNWLKEKGVSYDSLYVQCKSRNYDLELTKIMLKQLLSEVS